MSVKKNYNIIAPSLALIAMNKYDICLLSLEIEATTEKHVSFNSGGFRINTHLNLIPRSAIKQHEKSTYSHEHLMLLNDTPRQE